MISLSAIWPRLFLPRKKFMQKIGQQDLTSCKIRSAGAGQKSINGLFPGTAETSNLPNRDEDQKADPFI